MLNSSKRSILILLIFILGQVLLNAQSFRGISFTHDSSLWFSGTKGVFGVHSLKTDATYINTIDSFSTKDFRDIEAINKNIAFAMSVSDSGMIVRTENGGYHWQPVFQEIDSGVFFDVLEMDPNKQIGILLGDPLTRLPQYFYARITLDSGKSWLKFSDGLWNKTHGKLNALYAASGSSVKLLEGYYHQAKQQVCLTLIIAGGGPRGASVRFVKVHWKITGELISESIFDIPLNLPEENGWGVYALSEIHNNQVIVAGGNWQYVDGKYQDKLHSSVWQLSWNKSFLKKLIPKYAPKLKDLNITSYVSGVSFDENGNFACVGNQGIFAGNTHKLASTFRKIPLDPRYKAYNAVKLIQQQLYILGTSKKMSILKLPFSN